MSPSRVVVTYVFQGEGGAPMGPYSPGEAAGMVAILGHLGEMGVTVTRITTQYLPGGRSVRFRRVL